MNQDKYVFAQLTAFLNRTQFNNFVRKYDGNRYVKQFTCWNQLLAMMFGQLSNRESLRDLIVAFEAHRAKQYHLGLGRNPIAKATLAYANQNRDYRIFEDFAFYIPEFGISDSRFSCYARFSIGAYYICPPNNMDGKMRNSKVQMKFTL